MISKPMIIFIFQKNGISFTFLPPVHKIVFPLSCFFFQKMPLQNYTIFPDYATKAIFLLLSFASRKTEPFISGAFCDWAKSVPFHYYKYFINRMIIRRFIRKKFQTSSHKIESRHLIKTFLPAPSFLPLCFFISFSSLFSLSTGPRPFLK